MLIFLYMNKKFLLFLFIVMFVIIGVVLFLYLYTTKYHLFNKGSQKTSVFQQVQESTSTGVAKAPLISFEEPNKYSDIVGKDCLQFTMSGAKESTPTNTIPEDSLVRSSEVKKSFVNDYPKYGASNVRKDTVVFPVDAENDVFCAYVVAQTSGDDKVVLYYKMSNNKGKLMEF
jgi:hypothetical protein